MPFVLDKLLFFVGSKLAKKLAVGIVKVLVRRTDNKWDDEILAEIEKKEF